MATPDTLNIACHSGTLYVTQLNCKQFPQFIQDFGAFKALELGFPTWALLTIGAGKFLVVGAVLCTVGG